METETNLPSRCGVRHSLIVLMLALTLVSCNRERRMRVQTEEEPPRLAMMLSVADPRAKTQLVGGWYSLENNAWRWTARKFSATLRPPRGADAKGAVLKFKFNLPEVVTNQLKTISLSANVNGTELPPESYSQPGEYTYTREVPATAMTGDAVKVEFTLSKSIPPQGGDKRELGVIATMVGFEAK